MQLVLSCEHAGRRVPPEFATHLSSPEARAALATHEGWDLGAESAGRLLSERLQTPLLAHDVTRLLVDTNRRPARAFSRFTLDAPPGVRAEMLARYHTPHRERVMGRVLTGLERGPVLHVAVHSFTPVLGGQTRTMQLGLLYDPSMPWERYLGEAWAQDLRARLGVGTSEVRRNAPYEGRADGLCTTLRRELPAELRSRYAGFELELGQALLASEGRERWLEAVTESLRRLIASRGP